MEKPSSTRYTDNLDRLLALLDRARAEARLQSAATDPQLPYRALLAAIQRPARA